jgi:hypothetical protein
VGQVRVNNIAGSDVMVEVNLTGGLAPDMAIRLVSTSAATVTATDFVL